MEWVTRSTALVRDRAGLKKMVPLNCGYAESPIGIEPMTYALREAWSLAPIA